MSKGYFWKRLLRSLLSILIIMLIVFTMVYTLVPRENIFFEDSTYRKLSSKSDDKTEYVYSTWQKLGYLDYVRINDYALTLYEAGSPEMNEAVKPDSKESKEFAELYQFVQFGNTGVGLPLGDGLARNIQFFGQIPLRKPVGAAQCGNSFP